MYKLLISITVRVPGVESGDVRCNVESCNNALRTINILTKLIFSFMMNHLFIFLCSIFLGYCIYLIVKEIMIWKIFFYDTTEINWHRSTIYCCGDQPFSVL